MTDWRTLPEPWSNYQVSRCGKVKSTAHNKPRVLSQYMASGYMMVRLGRQPGNRQLVHRLVAMMWLDPPSDPLANEVHHIDADPTNNHADNLEWVTRQENMRIRWWNHYWVNSIPVKTAAPTASAKVNARLK